MKYKTTKAQRKRALEYYYKNREKVLTYQKKRWSIKFKEDEQFRERRYFRDATRRIKNYASLENESCVKCGSTLDLQRHHPNYTNPKEYTILCRTCHNKLHFK